MDSERWDEVSEQYYEEVLSPLKDSVKNPLVEELKKIPKTKKIIELGCGTGKLLKDIEKFNSATAIDFSENMIELAKKRNSNVELLVHDMTDLKKFHNKFDIVVSINSILFPDIKTIKKTINEIHSTLKKGGKFLAVLPSMEVYLYQALLIKEKQLKKGLSEKVALKKASKIINDKEHDFFSGKVNFENDEQKAFYRFELRHLFKNFKDIKIDKVLYSWEEFEKAGQCYFPNSALPWDWYLSCGK